MMDKLLLTPSECVELTGLGRSFVYEHIRRGEIPSVRIGRSVRVPVDKLRAWVTALVAAQQTDARDGDGA
jgi:excisionase family DNA binding protein